jgi:hypothetical protein
VKLPVDDGSILVFSQMERRANFCIWLCFVKCEGSAIFLLLVFYELERREHLYLLVCC